MYEDWVDGFAPIVQHVRWVVLVIIGGAGIVGAGAIAVGNRLHHFGWRRSGVGLISAAVVGIIAYAVLIPTINALS